MNNLLGIWISDPEGIPVDQFQRIQLEFTEDGQLIYTLVKDDSDDIMFLTYRIEGDTIISDQPSHPREEKTKFSFTPEGKLVLIYGKNEVRQFIRLKS